MYRGGAEQKIRKYLVDNNYVDCVIQLPSNLFFGTSIATCIMVMKKNKPDNKTLFIDATDECIKVTNNNKLTSENIDHIVDVFRQREEVEYFAHLATYEEVSGNDYNLSVSTYVESKDTREKPNSYKYRQYPFRNSIKNITLRQFFDEIGATDYEEFKEYVEHYNFEIEQILGLTVTSIPTQKTLEKHKEKVREQLLSCFFEEELRTGFTEQELTVMKKWFLKNYEVLLSNADFANSFVGSEWYYDLQVKTDVGLEQTAIVTGYLKSIEQLLCSILLTLCDEYYFYFNTNAQGKDKYQKDLLQLSYENLPYIKTMAGVMLKKIKGKKDKVCYRNDWTDRVIGFLEEYIEKNRNGYFHKDNLYEWDKIVEIRTKTYCAYFMILSTFKINKEQLSSIHLTKK